MPFGEENADIVANISKHKAGGGMKEELKRESYFGRSIARRVCWRELLN